MNIFLGSIYPDELLSELVRRKQYVDFPAHTFQQALLQGLKSQLSSLCVVTSPVIRSKRSDVYDICNKAYSPYKGYYNENDIYVGTTLIPGLQRLMEFVRVYRCLRKLLIAKDNNTLIIYALHSSFLLSAVLLSKRINCSCVVVPDLPEYMTSNNNIFRKLGKWVDRKLINYCIKRLDCFVLLSQYMRERLPIADKKWTLVEGIYSDIINTNKEKGLSRERIVLYTGNLSFRTGIMDLLAAFKQIEHDNYRLWIRGNGETIEAVLKAQEEDPRIKYIGPMSLEELRKLQRRATVLINPVRPSNEFTKYFFPSKTMEYLASGTPTIMYKLPCLPEDYYEHVYFVEEETIESLKSKIIEVCEKPQQELDKFGKKASDFIKSQKNAYVQSEKIVNMMRRL